MARTVVLNEEVKISLTQGGCAPLWMAAVMLAATWASETKASPDQARHLADAKQATTGRNLGSDEFETLLLRSGSSEKSLRVAQATTSDTRAPQQLPEQQRDWPGLLSCELALARRDIELLQHLEQEHDRVEWLVQGFDAARREVEAQKALAAKAIEEALPEQGNIGAARIVLERAVGMGSAQVNFTLAETYDPLILPNLGTYGTQGDLAKARTLYARVEAGGSKEAKA